MAVAKKEIIRKEQIDEGNESVAYDIIDTMNILLKPYQLNVEVEVDEEADEAFLLLFKVD